MVNYRKTVYKDHEVIEAWVANTRWDALNRVKHLARANHRTAMVDSIRNLKQLAKMPNSFHGIAYLCEHTSEEEAREVAKNRALEKYYASRSRAIGRVENELNEIIVELTTVCDQLYSDVAKCEERFNHM